MCQTGFIAVVVEAAGFYQEPYEVHGALRCCLLLSLRSDVTGAVRPV